MATVTYNNESFTCTTALKGTDYIHLLDSSGAMIVAFDGITDFTGFTISGGSWTTPTSADSCCFAVIEDDGTIGKSSHKHSDYLTGIANGSVTTAKIKDGAVTPAKLSTAIPIENGGTGATDRKTAFTNMVYLGGNPVTEATDTYDNWKALGLGVAYISGEGVLKGQPVTRGFLFNYTVGGILGHQVLHSCNPDAATYHRSCGGAGDWNTSGWVEEHNSYNLNPASLDAYGKVKPSQISSRRVNIEANTTLSAEHAGACIVTAADSNITITLPDDPNNSIFPLNTEIEIIRFYGGAATIKAPSSVYLYGIGASSTATGQSYSIANRYGVAVLKKLYATRWVISGDIG